MGIIKKIDSTSINFDKYKEITPRIYEDSKKLAKKLKNKKIIHLNSTQLGGGVSELLHSQTPLERSLGIDSSWYIINAPVEFFKTTKKIHNLLQGEKGSLTNSEKEIYLNWIDKEIAPTFQKLIQKEKPDIIVIHDPQPLPLIKYIPKDITPILRIHIDLSEPNLKTLEFLQPLIQQYKLVVLSHPEYRPQWLPKKKTVIIMPAINPFTIKNEIISQSKAKQILQTFNINTDNPIVSQVSRFDPWKDPLGVLKTFYIAKNKFPKLQLILAGLFQAKDDPQAKEMFEKVKKQAEGDSDIFLFADPTTIKDIDNSLFVNAIYTASTVVMQKSIKEGFGLTVTEAMLKGKPVIGGNTLGIALQIKHKKNGFLVSSPEEAAKYLIKLLSNKKLQNRIGKTAQKYVKDNFLLSRFVLDHLELYNNI
ncbi:MAG: glycosyltransferase [bacterium]